MDRPSTHNSSSCKILTFHVMGAAYVRRNHTYCDKKYLDWMYRCKLLLQRLESYDPDLLFLQGMLVCCALLAATDDAAGAAHAALIVRG